MSGSLCLAFLVASAMPALAWDQSEAQSEYMYGEFTEGAALIWRDSELLASPGEPSQALASLARGTLVEITGQPCDSMLRNGFGTFLYPVITSTGEQGLVAGPDMAMAWARPDPDATILLAMTARTDSLLAEFAGAVLVIDEKGEVLDSIPVWLPPLMYDPGVYDTWSYCTDIAEADCAGLDGVNWAVVLSMRLEACGYVNTDQVFAWNGSRLVEGPRASSVSEAGLFHTTGSLILPSDPGGEENRITVLSTSVEWIEADGAYGEPERSSTDYLWDGSSFTEE